MIYDFYFYIHVHIIHLYEFIYNIYTCHQQSSSQNSPKRVRSNLTLANRLEDNCERTENYCHPLFPQIKLIYTQNLNKLHIQYP